MSRTGPRALGRRRIRTRSARSPGGGRALGRLCWPAEPAKPDRSTGPGPLGCGGRHGGALRRPAVAHCRPQSAWPAARLYGVRRGRRLKRDRVRTAVRFFAAWGKRSCQISPSQEEWKQNLRYHHLTYTQVRTLGNLPTQVREKLPCPISSGRPNPNK